MIQTILAFFGYVKIPKEVVLLSMKLEDGYYNISKEIPGFTPLYNGAKTMTAFLRSGKLLDG